MKFILFILTISFLDIALANSINYVPKCPRLYFELNTCVDCLEKVDVDSMLVIGNSLTWHGELEEIGWFNAWGMAASSEENDWVHLIHNYISEDQSKNVKLNILKSFGIRTLSTLNKEEIESEWQTLNPGNLNYKVIFIQIGNNAIDSTFENFEKPYRKLLEFIREKSSAKIFLLGAWDTSNRIPDADSQIKALSEEYSAAFVDLSNLSQKIAYQANNEPICKKNLHINPGICLHPGDLGMKAIAYEVCHQGHTTRYNEITNELLFEDILVGSDHYSATLKNDGDFLFSVIDYKKLDLQNSDSHSAIFDPFSNTITIPKVKAFQNNYDVLFKRKKGASDLLFNLESVN